MKTKLIKISALIIYGLCIVLIDLFIGGFFTRNNTKQTSKELNCTQYQAVPKEYIARVPDQCTGQYFDYKKQEAEDLHTKQINAIKGIR